MYKMSDISLQNNSGRHAFNYTPLFISSRAASGSSNETDSYVRYIAPSGPNGPDSASRSKDAMRGRCATGKDNLVDVDWPTTYFITYFIIRYPNGPWAHSALLLEQTQRRIIQGTFFK